MQTYRLTRDIPVEEDFDPCRTVCLLILAPMGGGASGRAFPAARQVV
jgi:hypothetical protein